MRLLDVAERLAFRGRLKRIVQWELPPLTHVPLPQYIREAEWFRDAKLVGSVSMYAFRGDRIDGFSAKLMPALGAWELDEAAGKFKDRPIVTGSSSGNWLKDSGLIAPGFSVRGFVPVVNYGLPPGKLRHAKLSGCEDPVVAPEGIQASDYVHQFARERGYHLIDQYTHEGSIQGHACTMRHIFTGLQNIPGALSGFIFCAVMGTCSTLVAAHRYLRGGGIGPVKICGVASKSKEDKIPGSRTLEDLEKLKSIGGFMHRPEWKRVLDFPIVASVGKDEVYRLNALRFQRTHFSVGPTGALGEAGFYHLLRDHVEQGKVDTLRNSLGEILCVLFWMDANFAYTDDPEYAAYFHG
jgi:threonine dehydratase